jgi:hypothetical protein
VIFYFRYFLLGPGFSLPGLVVPPKSLKIEVRHGF